MEGQALLCVTVSDLRPLLHFSSFSLVSILDDIYLLTSMEGDPGVPSLGSVRWKSHGSIQPSFLKNSNITGYGDVYLNHSVPMRHISLLDNNTLSQIMLTELEIFSGMC